MNVSNSDKFMFNDFTVSHYEAILKLLKQNYIISSFQNFNKGEKFAIIRHDIDFSPHRSLRIASIENSNQIQSTYFVNIHSEYYNFFELSIKKIIDKIIELGHDIGVHFDAHYYNIQSEDQMIHCLIKEKLLLEGELNTPIKTFSFHNTNPFVLSFQKDNYGGLLNTYSEFFQKQVAYCSDSNGYWRYQRMYELIQSNQAPSLQILTHPEWWQEDVMSPWQRIKRAINGRAQKNMEDYTELIKSYGNKNIDW